MYAYDMNMDTHTHTHTRRVCMYMKHVSCVLGRIKPPARHELSFRFRNFSLIRIARDR